MTRSDQIRQLYADGWRQCDIARHIGVPPNYIATLIYCDRKGRRPRHVAKELRRAAAIKRAKPIIAAVENGMTYTQAAKKFRLSGRGAVAGIVDRWREANP